MWFFLLVSSQPLCEGLIQCSTLSTTLVLDYPQNLDSLRLCVVDILNFSISFHFFSPNPSSNIILCKKIISFWLYLDHWFGEEDGPIIQDHWIVYHFYFYFLSSHKIIDPNTASKSHQVSPKGFKFDIDAYNLPLKIFLVRYLF